MLNSNLGVTIVSTLTSNPNHLPSACSPRSSHPPPAIPQTLITIPYNHHRLNPLRNRNKCPNQHTPCHPHNPIPPTSLRGRSRQIKTLCRIRPRIRDLLQNGPKKRLPQLSRLAPSTEETRSTRLHPSIPAPDKHTQQQQWRRAINIRRIPARPRSPRCPSHDPLHDDPDHLRRVHTPNHPDIRLCHYARDVSCALAGGEGARCCYSA